MAKDEPDVSESLEKKRGEETMTIFEKSNPGKRELFRKTIRKKGLRRLTFGV